MKFTTPQQKKRFIIIAVIVAILLALAIATPFLPWNKRPASYEECAKQGNPILDSYSSVCVSKDGQHFINPNEQAPKPQ